jgi:DNA-binding response OmpR family regulator
LPTASSEATDASDAVAEGEVTQGANAVGETSGEVGADKAQADNIADAADAGEGTADGGADDNAGREGAGRQAIGPLSIDRRTRRVHLGAAEVQLTAKEFDLLAFLATDPGAVRTRTEILENVWDEHWYGPTKTVDAHVASIRKKLGSNGWIEAVRGVGFRLEPPA